MQNASGLFTGQGTVGGGASSLNGYLRAMEQSGVMRTLAEPTLTAISGEQATFRVGGEFNVVVGETTDSGNIIPVVNQIEYGIGPGSCRRCVAWAHQPQDPHLPSQEPTTREVSIEVAGQNLLSLRKRLADTPWNLTPFGRLLVTPGFGQRQHCGFSQKRPARPLEPCQCSARFSRSPRFVRKRNGAGIPGVRLTWHSPCPRQRMARPDDNFSPASVGAGFFPGPASNRVYGKRWRPDRRPGRYHCASVG